MKPRAAVDQPKYAHSKSLFSMTCAVGVNIRAGQETIWGLLTDAEGFPRWNSVVTRIQGRIQEGERIRIHVPGTKRTFTPKISGVVPNRRMIWSDGIGTVFKGVRTFTLTPRDDGSTDFAMEERFSGVVFATVRSMLPDFGPIFRSYAADLRREAEHVDSGFVRKVGAAD